MVAFKHHSCLVTSHLQQEPFDFDKMKDSYKKTDKVTKYFKS